MQVKRKNVFIKEKSLTFNVKMLTLRVIFTLEVVTYHCLLQANDYLDYGIHNFKEGIRF